MLELNKIYCMDCLEGMKQLPDNSVDLIVTDPPYDLTNDEEEMRGGGLFLKRNFYKDIVINNLDKSFDFGLLFDQFDRIIKKFNLFLFCNKKQIPQIINQIEFRSLNFDLLVWIKKNPIPTHFNKYLNDIEYIFHIKEKGAYMNNDDITLKHKYFINENGKTKFNHPTVKPLELIKNYIKLSSREGDLVLDPFMGSGTTAVACKQLNRQFIGFEISQEYVDIANKRLEQETIKKWFE